MPNKEMQEKTESAASEKKKAKLQSSAEDAVLKFRKEKKLFLQIGFRRRYRFFRRSGLGIFDSFFNAWYILLCEKSITAEKSRREKNGLAKEERDLMNYQGALLKVLSFLSRSLGFARKKISSGKSRFEKVKQGIGSSQRRALGQLVFPLVLVLVALFSAVYMLRTLDSPVVFRAEINGQVVAVVQDSSVVESAIRELEENVAIILGERFRFPYEVKYSLSAHENKKETEKKVITEQLYGMIRDSVCTAGGLYVDDTLVAVCKDEKTVRRVLEQFTVERAQGAEAGILNEISVIAQAYPTECIISEEELRLLLEKMCVPLEERQKEENNSAVLPDSSLEETESVPSVTLMTDTSFHKKEDRLIRTNRPQSIQKIKLDFYTVEYQNYDAPIPYDTVYEESNKHYTAMAEIAAYGVDGLAHVQAKVYFVEGKEARREIISQTVKKHPVTRVITLGTKLMPEEMGDPTYPQGRFILPNIWKYGIYSDYGWRDGVFHHGVDIPGKRGNPLYAAASGTVVVAIGQDGYFSNYPHHSYSGYGYVVVIDHGDGFSTMYAHCNRINVTLGQKVKQGDKIAEMGSTGDSTGNHVHFEIMIWDRKVNPHLYLYSGNKTIYDR